jgi:peptidoglycan/LPS O-acetylase OafA/YrhL
VPSERGLASPAIRAQAGGRPRLDTLTGLRAVAALAVFAVHVIARLEGAPAEAWSYVAAAGGMGVTFFFALSGFVLTWAHRDGDEALPFWRRRFARIYPAYFVALLGGLLVTVASHSRTGVSSAQSYDNVGDLLGPFVAQLTLTQSWVSDDRYFFSLNGVGWSLSCEAFFYACFPALILWLARASRRTRLATQMGAVALLAGLALLVEFDAFPGAGWLQGTAPITTILPFILGITIALDVTEGRWSRISFRWSVAAVGVVYLACCAWPSTFVIAAIPIIPFLALLAAGSWRHLRGESSVFSTPTFVWLGEVSYCFYLVHQLVIRCMGVFGGTDSWFGAAVQILVSLALSLLAAWLLHVLVEKPFERRLRGSSRARPPVTVDPEPSPA